MGDKDNTMKEYLVKCEITLEIEAEKRSIAVKRARRWDGCTVSYSGDCNLRWESKPKIISAKRKRINGG